MDFALLPPARQEIAGREYTNVYSTRCICRFRAPQSRGTGQNAGEGAMPSLAAFKLGAPRPDYCGVVWPGSSARASAAFCITG